MTAGTTTARTTTNKLRSKADGYIIGIARGCSGCTCTPRAWKKFRRNLQGKCVSAPPGHEVHPQPEQESILGQFLLGGLDLEVYLDGLWGRRLKKVVNFFGKKNAPQTKSWLHVCLDGPITAEIDVFSFRRNIANNEADVMSVLKWTYSNCKWKTGFNRPEIAALWFTRNDSNSIAELIQRCHQSQTHSWTTESEEGRDRRREGCKSNTIKHIILLPLHG